MWHPGAPRTTVGRGVGFDIVLSCLKGAKQSSRENNKSRVNHVIKQSKMGCYNKKHILLQKMESIQSTLSRMVY